MFYITLYQNIYSAINKKLYLGQNNLLKIYCDMFLSVLLINFLLLFVTIIILFCIFYCISICKNSDNFKGNVCCGASLTTWLFISNFILSIPIFINKFTDNDYFENILLLFENKDALIVSTDKIFRAKIITTLLLVFYFLASVIIYWQTKLSIQNIINLLDNADTKFEKSAKFYIYTTFIIYIINIFIVLWFIYDEQSNFWEILIIYYLTIFFLLNFIVDFRIASLNRIIIYFQLLFATFFSTILTILILLGKNSD